MPLTQHDIDGARAQWEEWTAGLGFELRVEVKDAAPPPALKTDGQLAARLTSEPYVRLKITRTADGSTVFEGPAPCTPRALQLIVGRLARAVANPWGRADIPVS